MITWSQRTLEPIRVTFAWLLRPFVVKGNLSVSLLFAFLCITGLVLVNAVLHPPLVGYDAADHLAYVEVLATKGFPLPSDSLEFFSAPLPYFVPAALYRWTFLDLNQAGKMAQMTNVVLSVVTCIYLLEVCRLLAPDTATVRLGALAALAVLTVYYKSFAFVRGEPYVACFTAASLYYGYLTLVKRTHLMVHTLAFGSSLGLACLARQWGFLLFPGFGLYGLTVIAQSKQSRAFVAGVLARAFCLALLICGWFYLLLFVRYGTIAAFNREGEIKFALTNQPREFYTGLGLPHLFADPVRDHFPNILLPTLYADTWGDYWGYFTVYGKDLRTGRWLDGSEWSREVALPAQPWWFATNRYSASRFLGRVQIAGLFPSLVMAASVVYGGVSAIRYNMSEEHETETAMARMLLSLVGTSLAGYLGFLIMFPSPDTGDTIKATYILHVFPLLAILVGLALQRLARRSRALYVLTIVGFAGVFVYSLPAYVTQYSAMSSVVFSGTRIVVDQPAPRSPVHILLAIRGTVRSAKMTQYSLWYGYGTAPTEWEWISGPHTAPVDADLLTDVTLSGLAPGPYVLRVTVELQDRRVAERHIPFTVLAEPPHDIR